MGKPCGFPLICDLEDIKFPCCCMLPKLETQGEDGNSLGSNSEYLCDIFLCVPKLAYKEGGQTIYILRPETCCGGCCPTCDCSGKGCIYVPFYFHDPVNLEPVGGYDDKAPQIQKV